jgi:hypothetical protein
VCLAPCSPSAKSIPTPSRTRISLGCSRNSRALKAASRRRGGTTSGLQHRAQDLPLPAVGNDRVPQQQVDGGVHRERRRAEPTASRIGTSRCCVSAVQTGGSVGDRVRGRSPSNLDQLFRPFVGISCSGWKVPSQLLAAQVNGSNKAVAGPPVLDR